MDSKFYTHVSQHGDDMLHRYIDNDGNRQAEIVKFKPTLYISSDTGGFKSIKGDRLRAVKFDSIYGDKGAHTACKLYDQSMQGNRNYWAQFIREKYPKKIDWDITKLVVANLDIECFIDDPDNPGCNPLLAPIDAPNRITAITINVNDTYYVFGSKPYEWSDIPLNANYSYHQDESDLIESFLARWCDINPDIITGWNIDNFDIPYLYGRMLQLLDGSTTNKFSSAFGHKIKNPIKYTPNNEGKGGTVAIKGISTLDYLTLYKRFSFKLQERYSLDYISYVELGTKKLDYSEYGNLDDLYHNDYKKYIDYNIRDTELVNRLDEKLKLIETACALIYKTKIRQCDVFGQVKMWDTIIYNALLDDDVVVPRQEYTTKSSKYAGAYVMEPVIGMHDWVVSFDLDSLYPHIIMQYNISPECIINKDYLIELGADVLLQYWDDEKCVITIDIESLINGDNHPIIPELKKFELSMCGSGALFRKDVYGFLPKQMDIYFNERKVEKGSMIARKKEIQLLRAELKRRELNNEDIPQ